MAKQSTTKRRMDYSDWFPYWSECSNTKAVLVCPPVPIKGLRLGGHGNLWSTRALTRGKQNVVPRAYYLVLWAVSLRSQNPPSQKPGHCRATEVAFHALRIETCYCRSAMWHKMPLHTQHVIDLYQIWTAKMSGKELSFETIKSYPLLYETWLAIPQLFPRTLLRSS